MAPTHLRYVVAAALLSVTLGGFWALRSEPDVPTDPAGRSSPLLRPEEDVDSSKPELVTAGGRIGTRSERDSVSTPNEGTSATKSATDDHSEAQGHSENQELA